MKRSIILLSLLIINSCGKWDNPFIPKADPEVVSVVAQNVQLGVSISQKFRSANNMNIAEYTFVEPTVTIANKLGLPRVVFKQMVIEFTVGQNKLPPKIIPTAITVPTGGVFSGPIPILSASDDILKAVYPNNSFGSISTGFADVTLVGKDDNDNVVALKFTTPVRFLSDPSGIQVPTNNQQNQNQQNNNQNNNQQNNNTGG
ncbi:MAG: hypothetical protein KatS3mg068_0216 [Candidatus Sericytochromatia bacterium]|nr:MAG: hypothetical protein KatS3mg068_0216 [Candidatus Sericytochromatia bacterium]